MVRGRGSKSRKRHAVAGERFLLPLMIHAHEIDEFTGRFTLGNFVGKVCHDGRTKAVCARYEDDVVRANAIAQKPRVCIGMNEDTANMAKVQVLVAVWHTCRDDCTFRKLWAVRTVTTRGPETCDILLLKWSAVVRLYRRTIPSY